MNIIITITQQLLAFAYWFLSLFWYRLKVSGRENVSSLQGPLIIVANHKSFADHFFIGAGLPSFLASPLLPIRIMAKDSLFKNLLSRALFTLLGAYPAYYKQGLDVSLRQPLSLLANARVVGIYPEGRMIQEEGIGSFKRGAGELIARAKSIKILPVVVKNTTNMHWRLIPRLRQVIEVHYGIPLVIEGQGPAASSAIVYQRLLELYEGRPIAVPASTDTLIPKQYAE